MFDYLQQFNKLPKELREKVSSPAAMDVLLSLEKKYNVSLAMLVMQIMVKQMMFKDLPAYFSVEMGLSLDKAEALTEELREKIFFSVSSYLGLKDKQKSLDPEEKDLELIMKENSIILPSQELLSRCRKILLTYRKGIRSKIDVRSSLEKPIANGGLGLDPQATERLLKALEKNKTSDSSQSKMDEVNKVHVPKSVQNEVDQLINRQAAESTYDLKDDLDKGKVKIPEKLRNRFQDKVDKLDLSHELEAPEERLALEAPELGNNLQTNTKEDLVVKDQAKKTVSASTIAPPPPPPPPPSRDKEKKSMNESVVADVKGAESQGSGDFKLEATSSKPNEASSSLSPEKVLATKDLQPQNVSSQSFKKKPSGSNLRNKFFSKSQDKGNTDKIASSNLEEMVKTASLQSQLKSRPAASSDSKTKMEDVKLKPKVMGPLEELRYLDIVNFRRLGSSPEEITQKIIMKIKLLKKDGYDRMVQGVQSWRQSPVNKTYIRIVQEAINKGLTLQEVIEARQNAKKEGLSKEEIEAIIDMNTKLMF